MRRRRWSAFATWRDVCPDLALRSTFIVGFPGETEADFDYLLDWLDEAQIDRAGAFKYEPVAGAPANDLGLAPVPDEVKEMRWKRFMEKQQTISARLMKRKVGKRLAVMIDEPGGGPRARRPRAAPRPMRRRSTARPLSRRGARCAPATS